MREQITDVAKRAGWRAADAFLSALFVDNVLQVGLPEWKVALVAAASAGLKPVMAFVSSKAGSS